MYTALVDSRTRLLCNCRVEEQSGHINQVSVAQCVQQFRNTGFVARVLQGFVGCVAQCIKHACQFTSVRRASSVPMQHSDASQ